MTSTCPLSPRKMALGPSPFRASWRAKLQGVPPCSSWKIRSGVGNGHAARREGMGTGRWAGWHTATPGLLPGLSSGVGGERREVTRGNKKRKSRERGRSTQVRGAQRLTKVRKQRGRDAQQQREWAKRLHSSRNWAFLCPPSLELLSSDVCRRMIAIGLHLPDWGAGELRAQRGTRNHLSACCTHSTWVRRSEALSWG